MPSARKMQTGALQRPKCSALVAIKGRRCVCKGPTCEALGAGCQRGQVHVGGQRHAARVDLEHLRQQHSTG